MGRPYKRDLPGGAATCSERFCKMFSESSPGCWPVLQLPCCPSKQGKLSENILQNLRNKWPPHLVLWGDVEVRPRPDQGHDERGEDEEVPQGRQRAGEGLFYVVLLMVEGGRVLDSCLEWWVGNKLKVSSGYMASVYMFFFALFWLYGLWKTFSLIWNIGNMVILDIWSISGTDT